LRLVLGLALAPAMAGCWETPTSRGTGQYVDDVAIKTKMKAALIKCDVARPMTLGKTCTFDTQRNITMGA